MKKTRFLVPIHVVILGTCLVSSARGADIVWLGEDDRRIVDSSGSYVDQFSALGTGLYGGMTSVGSEIWVGFLDSSTVLRVDFEGNVLGSLPAFTTESTGGMTTVGDEVWWGSADSTTILRLDFAGNILGTIVDPGGLRFDPTGGMATVGDEVWWGPAGQSLFGAVLWRYDHAGNWLGTPADPIPGLIEQPVSGEETAGMTVVGDEVWWAEVGPGVTSLTSDIYRMDFSGNVLGSFCIPNPFGCGPYPENFGAMTAVPLLPAVPSIHPIAVYTLVPGLLIGLGLASIPWKGQA